MSMESLISRVRHIEIKTRRLSQNFLQDNTILHSRVVAWHLPKCANISMATMSEI